MNIPRWPIDAEGLTAEDVPADYNVFPDVWNDGKGYEPIVVGRIPNDTGGETILISLSPGNTISATLPVGGEDQVRAALEAVRALGAAGRQPLRPAPDSPPTGPAGQVGGE